MRFINALQALWPYIIRPLGSALIMGLTILFTVKITVKRLRSTLDIQTRDELKDIIRMREHTIAARDERIDELERENGCLQAKVMADSELAQRINTLSLGIIQDHTTVDIGMGKIAHR